MHRSETFLLKSEGWGGLDVILRLQYMNLVIYISTQFRRTIGFMSP